METFIATVIALLGLYLLYVGIVSFRGSDTWLLLVKAIIVSSLGFILSFGGIGMFVEYYR